MSKNLPFYVGARRAKDAARKTLRGVGLLAAVATASHASADMNMTTPAEAGGGLYAIARPTAAPQSGNIVILSRLERDTTNFTNGLTNYPNAAKLSTPEKAFIGFSQSLQGMGRAFAQPKVYGQGYDVELQNINTGRDLLERIGVKTIPYEDIQTLFNLNELLKLGNRIGGGNQQPPQIPPVNLGPVKVALLQSIAEDQPQIAAQSMNWYLRISLGEHTGIMDKKSFGGMDLDSMIYGVRSKTIPSDPQASISSELARIDSFTTAPTIFDAPRKANTNYSDVAASLKDIKYAPHDPILKALDARAKKGLSAPATYSITAGSKPALGLGLNAG